MSEKRKKGARERERKKTCSVEGSTISLQRGRGRLHTITIITTITTKGGLRREPYDAASDELVELGEFEVSCKKEKNK